MSSAFSLCIADKLFATKFLTQNTMKAKILLLMAFVFSFLAVPVFAQSYALGSEPTVTTDKDDYALVKTDDVRITHIKNKIIFYIIHHF